MAMPADEIAVFITADMSAHTSGMNILICLARDTSIATEFFYLCVFPDFLGYCRWILMDLPADLEERKVTVKAFLDRDTVREGQVFIINFGSSHTASLSAQARRSATACGFCGRRHGGRQWCILGDIDRLVSSD